MNWKSLQIRQKLYLGFGIMVLVTALFGGILLNGLYNINKSSKLLYNEQIPALSDTYELQNHWQKAVFNLRTFSTQKEEQYFVLANHHINRAINILDSLQTHNNEKANSSWQSLKKELDNFKKQAQKSYKAAIQIDNSYEQLDSAQTELQKLSDNYLGLQYQKLKRDVDKKAPDHIIKRRVDKISLMNEIVDITKDLKVKIGETHFRNKPELLNNLGPSFDIIRMNVETILPMTTKQYDIDALNEILKQNKICETSTGNLRNNWLSYSKMNNHDFLERGLSLTMNMAKHKEDYLARSAFSNLQHASNARNSWWWSISLSLIAGGILAWLISRSLSDPLLDLTKLAELQADGFLVSVPDTQRNDEIGILTRSMQAHQQQTHTIVN
ncbi:MAG: MCP four helix bundle domain-containing protein, partial [Bacteroidota bacterium]